MTVRHFPSFPACDSENKVITTMVIWSLDDRMRYAQSVVVDLQPLGLGYVGIRDGGIRLPALGFLLAPHWHIWSNSYRF